MKTKEATTVTTEALCSKKTLHVLCKLITMFSNRESTSWQFCCISLHEEVEILLSVEHELFPMSQAAHHRHELPNSHYLLLHNEVWSFCCTICFFFLFGASAYCKRNVFSCSECVDTQHWEISELLGVVAANHWPDNLLKVAWGNRENNSVSFKIAC